MKTFKIQLFIVLSCLLVFPFQALKSQSIKWNKDGNGYFAYENSEIVEHTILTGETKTLVAKDQLIPTGETKALKIRSFSFSADYQKVLIYTNSKKVWRYDTRGDYWVLDIATKQWHKLGKSRPASTLMFAKFSPDGTKAAYVSEHNVYVEDINSGDIKALTSTDGTKKLINGTFDWAYEEEFGCRDGFRWSPDGQKIAFWQIDANTIRDYYMLNTTDSIYSKIVPVEYPKVGESPSACRIGVVEINSAKTIWMNVEGDNRQHYIPRMEWSGSQELILQQLNRKQNESKIIVANVVSGQCSSIFSEKDEAWIDIKSRWNNDDPTGWEMINGGKDFLWVSEKDGWRHIYKISKDGKKETLLTAGNYDIMSIERIDEKAGVIYFMASPGNATQKYLYKVSLAGKGALQKVSPAIEEGTHGYQISTNGKFAMHRFSNYYTSYQKEWVALPEHKSLKPEDDISKKISAEAKKKSNVEFFKIKTEDGVEMDGWMVKPTNFDPAKKYPVVFYVYSEPAAQTVEDSYGSQQNFLYNGNMAEDGYICMSLDNRGTPAPKGSKWRKSIYRNIGKINIRDQAMGVKKIIEWSYIDAERIAVWGWSGGGSATLNLLFQYPDLYKTGIAIAAVANQLSYDNIYQERYMGVPEESREDFVQGSPIYHAKNLKGNLLYIHGTGDDNVHYQNAEMLLNELIKHNKQFQFMPYPNRTHSISEGEGTFMHLRTLYTSFLKKNCPGGAK